jgi:hypothetical protein
MRILAMHKSNSFSEAGHAPPPEMMAAMGQLVGSMMQRGILVATEGLCPSVQGARLTFHKGKRTVTPGPLKGANEHIAGFGILRVRDLEEAIAWATKFAESIGDVEIDVRPVSEPWDIGAMPKPDGLTTRRYMAARKADRTTESGAMPSKEAMARTDAVIEEMTKAGVLVASIGLAPSAQGARARFNNGSRTVTDGPFTEAKELIAGYAVLEAPSVKAAIDLSADFAKIIGDVEIDFLPIVKMEAR